MGDGQVIGVIAALIFGPKNLAGLGKDLGKIAGSLKAEVRTMQRQRAGVMTWRLQAQTFSSAMQESLEEAEKGMKEAETQVGCARWCCNWLQLTRYLAGYQAGSSHGKLMSLVCQSADGIEQEAPSKPTKKIDLTDE